jgi:hypothetical protein
MMVDLADKRRVAIPNLANTFRVIECPECSIIGRYWREDWRARAAS